MSKQRAREIALWMPGDSLPQTHRAYYRKRAEFWGLVNSLWFGLSLPFVALFSIGNSWRAVLVCIAIVSVGTVVLEYRRLLWRGLFRATLQGDKP